MTTRNIIAAGLIASMAAVAHAEVPLKIYRPTHRTDTVYKPTYYLIGVTENGASAKINGNDCHVYRTGSFGAELNLAEGDNVIPVEVTRNGQTATEQINLVYVKRPAAPAQAPEATVPLKWPLNVVTKDGAYLQYGNGGDRLGGSKMGFLEPGIELTAVGETSGLYKVMLGETGSAYIPKSSVEQGGAGARTVNTGSASVSNTGKTDRLVISLPCRLPYSTRTEIDPSAIKVSLYGATNNTNWLTCRNDLGMIKFIDMVQEPGDVLTFELRLKEKYAWGYEVRYEGNNLVVEVRHRPRSLALKDLVIGLDAGHGGEFPGAISPSGLTEKEVNLDIILNVAEMLRSKGATVVLTRDGDTGPSMAERKRIWKEANVDLAISVHNNSSGNPLVPMGTSAYYKHIANMPLADALHRSMLSMGLANFGLTGNFNFSLNSPTEYPNALIEVLFMSSLPEEELLADPAYRRKLAQNIVKGLTDYLDTVKKSL